MFDIGFWELAVLGLIGLIVLGPERLPVVARTLGRWVRSARQYASALTTELENEVGAEDIRDDVRRARERIESETREFRADTERSVEPLMEPIEGEAEKREPRTTADAENAPRISDSGDTEQEPDSHSARAASNSTSLDEDEQRS